MNGVIGILNSNLYKPVTGNLINDGGKNGNGTFSSTFNEINYIFYMKVI